MTARSRLTAWVIILAAAASAVFVFTRESTPAGLTTQPITRGDVVEAVGATGTVEAVTTVQVGTQVSGTVQALYADFNATVRRGTIIARLDPSLFETQVEQARASLTRAEADLERLRLAERESRRKFDQAHQLSVRGLTPQSDLDTAEANALGAAAQVRSAEAQVIQARASLNQATVSLSKTVITAPISGTVIARNVDVGQTVAASLQAPTLFVLAADLMKMRVNASINEADVGRVLPGQTARFRVDAFPADEFVGTLSLVRLSPVVQQNVVTYAAVIDVPNPDLKLRPGMTATVTVECSARRNVLRLPNAALRFRPTDEALAAYGRAASPASSAGGRSQRPIGGDAAGRPGQPEAGSSRPSTEPSSTPPSDSGAWSTEPEEGERTGEIWLLTDAGLQPVSVRIGVTDGIYAELLEPPLPEGIAVVTGVASAASSPTTGGSPMTNPLMGPQRPPGGRGGGR